MKKILVKRSGRGYAIVYEETAQYRIPLGGDESYNTPSFQDAKDYASKFAPPCRDWMTGRILKKREISI